MNIDYKNVLKHFIPRTHEKMREVLMDPQGMGPAIHYYMIRGGRDQKNITVWEPGTISGEYIKTYGHYHVGNIEESYSVLFGEGIALLQRLAVDSNGSIIADVVEEFKAIIVKPDDSIHMEPGWGHVLVNTCETFLVTSDNTVVSFDDAPVTGTSGHVDYLSVKSMQGFAYYVVEHNGKPALKRNPKYKIIQKEDLAGLSVIE